MTKHDPSLPEGGFNGAEPGGEEDPGSHLRESADTENMPKQVLTASGLDTSRLFEPFARGLDTSRLVEQIIGPLNTHTFAEQFARGLDTSRLAEQLLASSAPQIRLVAYDEAARHLLRELRVQADTQSDPIPFVPSSNDSAFRAIEQAAPEVAAAIDMAAANTRISFWKKKVVRNARAWLLVTLVIVAHVGGTVLFPPWGSIVVALLSAGGVSAPGVYKHVAAPHAED